MARSHCDTNFLRRWATSIRIYKDNTWRILEYEDAWFKSYTLPVTCITSKDKNLTEDAWYLKTQLMWRSIPLPYLTVPQLKVMLRIVSGDASHAKACIEHICERYERYFSEECEIFKPRSLKHLCRCTIRNVLEKNLQLSSGINTLDIPGVLFDYLNLKP